MTRISSKSHSFGATLAGAAAGASMLLGLAGPASADGSSFLDAARLIGVWSVVTQERHCATNAPLGPATRALVTYHVDGAVSESRFIPIFAIGQLTEGHGTWRAKWDGTVSGRVVAMVNFDTPSGTPPGVPVFQAGWQVATQSITLVDRDTFTMTGSSEFVNLSQQVYRVGCASREGKRFK